jgi:hypothetical protein
VAQINASASGGSQITASVGETQIDVSVSGGVGPTGPSGTVSVSAPITNSGTSTSANIGLSTGAGLSAAGGSLSVSYGASAGTSCQGNDARLSDSREWSASTVTQADAEAGTSTSRFAFTPLRVFQAIAAWWAASAAKAKLDGIAAGATANATDAQLRDRSTHTGSQTASTISDFTSAVVAAAPPTTNASLLTSGTLDAARLPGSVVLTTDSRLSDARTPLSHTHDDRYYTEGEVDSLLTGKQAAGSYAASVHTHTAADISDFTSAVVAAAPPTTNASLLTSGTLPDARLSSSIARTSDVTAAVAAVVNAAPAALDTLNELAAALGNDASFATTVTNSLAGKANVSHTHTVSAITDAGTAATRNVPATGNASSSEVVLGSDTRLTDQRVPTDGSVTSQKLGALTTVGAGAFSAGAGGVSSIGAISQRSVSNVLQFNVSNAGIVTVGQWQATAVAVAYGGTGATDAATARTNLGLGTAATANTGDFAASLHTHSVTDVTATGTPSASTFLRGDGTWAAAGSSSASDLTTGTLANARLTTRARASMNLYLWSSFR